MASERQGHKVTSRKSPDASSATAWLARMPQAQRATLMRLLAKAIELGRAAEAAGSQVEPVEPVEPPQEAIAEPGQPAANQADSDAKGREGQSEFADI